jgi:glutamate carboxypeptidase
MAAKYLKLLEKMVNTNSGTGNFAGAEKIRSMIRSELIPLGFKELKKGDPKGHQVFAYERNHTTPKKIFLYGHIDTVFSKESTFQKMRIEGDKIYGPGIIDMKSGVVMILNLISNFKTQPKLLDQIRVVITDDEETISSFGTPFLDEFGKGIPYGLIFEPGLKDGSVVTSHSGVHWIDLMVKGKAAHAGLAHKDGVNACVELGEKVYRISQLTEYKKGLTFSPDVMRGGSKTNIVCDSATAQIDIRFIQNTDLQNALKQIAEILTDKKVKSENTGERVSFEVKPTAHFSSLESKSTEKLFELAKSVSKKDGVNLNGVHVGYGTDGGHLAEQGMQVLVGVGPYGEGIHTDHEYMLTSSYTERLKMNQGIIEALLTVEW